MIDLAEVLGRLIRLFSIVVVAVIALEVLFLILDANPGNPIVHRIAVWSHTLAGPFEGIFQLHSARWTSVLNYLIAVVVYLLVAQLLISLLSALLVPMRRRAGEGRGEQVVR